MGHLAIVNQDTIENVIKTGYISTRGELKMNALKTIADILSDVLATRVNDLVFPWIIGGRSSKNLGFKYVFRIAGPPIYVAGDRYPIKIPLQISGNEYPVPLSEAEALDLWDKKLLWNAIGKKSLGRGRSLTHQLPMEDERMLDLLDKKNSNLQKTIEIGQSNYRSPRISINASQDSWNDGFKIIFDQANPSERISLIDPEGLPWRKGNRFKYEKTLEAWLMENMDTPLGAEFRNEVLHPAEEIEWFGNYLPFGVAGASIDIVVVQSGKKGKQLEIIELKVGPLNQRQYLSAARQVINYARFIERAFNSFEIQIETCQAAVICCVPNGDPKYSLYRENGREVKLVSYSIKENGAVQFKRLA